MRDSSKPPKKLLEAFAWVEKKENSWEDVEQNQHYESQQHEGDIVNTEIVQMAVKVNCIFHHFPCRGMQTQWSKEVKRGNQGSGVGQDESSSKGINDRGTRVDISVHLDILLVNPKPRGSKVARNTRSSREPVR